MSFETCAITVGLLFALSGCDGNMDAKRRAGGPLVLDASDVHLVGTSESIAIVRDLEALTDGSIWVLNSVAPFFVGFESDGTLIRTHGTSGGGPEEFAAPSAFVTRGIDGHSWVFDRRRHSLVQVSEPADAWSEIPIPRDSLPLGSLTGGMDMLSNVVRTGRLGNEILFARTTGSLQSGIFSFRMAILGADLLAWNPTTSSVRTVLALGDVVDDPTVGFELTEGGFPLWYRLWAVCGDNQIAVYDRVRNAIRRFAGEGTELAPTELPPVAFTEATPRQFAQAIFGLAQAEATGNVGRRLTGADSAEFINAGMQQLKGNPRQLAAYLPRYVDFRCADDGTAWVQPFDLDVGGLAGTSTWLRLAADGTSQEVRLPDRFDAFRFTGTRIWGVQRDEFDVATVAWIELPSKP